MEQTLQDRVDPKRLQNLPIVDPVSPNKKYSEKEEKYLRELVKYEFSNLEEPGVPMRFSYGNASNKHTFTLLDGGKYMLPRFIARHIESRATPIWKWRPDGTGSLRKELTTTKRRFQMREVFE